MPQYQNWLQQLSPFLAADATVSNLQCRPFHQPNPSLLPPPRKNPTETETPSQSAPGAGFIASSRILLLTSGPLTAFLQPTQFTSFWNRQIRRRCLPPWTPHSRIRKGFVFFTSRKWNVSLKELLLNPTPLSFVALLGGNFCAKNELFLCLIMSVLAFVNGIMFYLITEYVGNLILSLWKWLLYVVLVIIEWNWGNASQET